MSNNVSTRLTFWFDLENAPNVLFFDPIIKKLLKYGHTVKVTCRNYSSTPEIARLHGLNPIVIGQHGGEKKISKVIYGLKRCIQMIKWVKNEEDHGTHIDLAIGFGSRTLAFACKLMKIPNATATDYEYSDMALLGICCDKFFIPKYVSLELLISKKFPVEKAIYYNGAKEEVYARHHKPDTQLLDKLQINPNNIIIIVRPPATFAHYHDDKSTEIFNIILKKISNTPNATGIFIPRDNDITFDVFLKYPNIHKIPFPVKGLDLISVSDLVISGGGTMVREAAALGIPAYSAFTGNQCAIDKALCQKDKLTFINNENDIIKIKIQKRIRNHTPSHYNENLCDFFTDQYIKIAKK